MNVNIRENVNKLLGRQESKDGAIENKVAKMYNTNQGTYNPFLDKSGNLINPYIDYQKVLDNGNVSARAKAFIQQATGLSPTAKSNTVQPSKTVTPASFAGSEQGMGETDSIASGNKFADTAKKFLGTPYVWGGTTPDGFDCSGLTQYVYAQNGISIPRVSQDQFKSGAAVSSENLQPGDLVFFAGYTKDVNNPGHVGIYVGNGEYLHAPKTGDVVKVSKLSSRSDYVGARRYN